MFELVGGREGEKCERNGGWGEVLIYKGIVHRSTSVSIAYTFTFYSMESAREIS